MRSLFAATVLFFPAVLLPAQAARSGVSSLDAMTSITRSVFSLTPPTRIASAPGTLTLRNYPLNAYGKGEVVVKFIVGTDGVPQNIEVTKPLNQLADGQVVAAVKELHYTPAKLDGQVIAMPVTLSANFNQ